jgi:regulator of protease activity HflC (stomatin/prohibitin superfamily)
MLEAMRVPDIDTLLPDPNDIPHADPVSEGAYLFVGKPVRAHVDEDHAAHLIIHQAQMQTVVNSPLAETVQAALMAHIAEHVALQYQIQMSQLLGLPLPQPDLSNKKREGMDVAIANQIAMQAAMGIQNMQAMQQAQMQQQVQAEQEGEAQAAQAENARADEGMQAEQQRKDAAFQADEERKNLALEAQITRDQIKAASDYLKQVGAMDIDPMQLIQTARELGTSFDEALRILREAQMGGLGSGQGQGPAPIAQEAL